MKSQGVCIVLLGIIAIAASQENKELNHVFWSETAAGDTDLQRQFDADWEQLDDPLNWINDATEVNSFSESTETSNSLETDSKSESEEDSSSSEEQSSEDNANYQHSSEEITEDGDESEENPEEDESSDETNESQESSDETNESLESSEETNESLESIDEPEVTGFPARTGRRGYGRKGWETKRKNRRRRPPQRKRWPMRKRPTMLQRARFRNPHGSTEQIPHPPPTGRWYRVWQKFNRSEAARSGRWNGMFARTQQRRHRIEAELAERMRNATLGDGGNSWNETHDWKSRNPSSYRSFQGHNHTHHNHTHHNHKHHHHTHHHQSHHHLSHHRNHGGHGRHRHHFRQDQDRPRKCWLEHKAEHVCGYLASERHQRFVQYIQERRQLVQDTNPDYRINFTEQMSKCCQLEFEGKLKCFANLTRARVDEFCQNDTDVPFRPWKSGQDPRAARTIKTNCCLSEGQARYDCFSRTHQVLQWERYRIIQPAQSEESEAEPPGVASPSLPEPVVIVNRRRQRPVRKHHKMTQKQKMKNKCCAQGKALGHEMENPERAKLSCNRAARRVVAKAKNLNVICYMAYGRCCINEARKRPVRENPEEESDAVDVMEQYEDLQSP